MDDIGINLRVKSDDAAVKSTGLKFTELSSAIGLAKQAFALIKGVADEVIGSFTSYAKVVEDMARVTGSGAEETSRLIQVADDLQISATDLSTALAGAVRKGIDPSVQSIAALSDEYLKLQPGLEQSKFLMDNFGRSGLAMARLMEQGSDAILEMGAAVDDSLIITEDAIKANQDYYASLDTLNDAFEGVKVSLGQKLVPVLTQAAEAMGLLVGWSDKLEAAFATQETSLENTATSYREYAIGSIAAADAAGQLDERQQRIAQALMDGAISGDMARERMLELADALGLTDEKTWTVTQSTTDWMDALDGVRSEADDTRQSYVDLGLTLDDVKSTFNETTKEMLFNAAAENLTADEALKLAIQMGLVNAETLGYQASMEELNAQLASDEITVGEYRAAVAALGEQIDAVAHPYDIMVNFTYDSAAFAEMYAEIGRVQQAASGIGISAGGGQIPEARANGGPVVGGRPYIVGERGPEVIVPQQAGYVIPNRGSALTTYNIVINGNASATDIIRRARIAEAYGV